MNSPKGLGSRLRQLARRESEVLQLRLQLRRRALRRRLPDLFDTLGSLLESGIPIRDALRFAADMRYPKSVRAYVVSLAEAVENGKRFGDTPELQPDPWLAILLESGELSGSLADVLQAWCRQSKQLRDWRNSLWRTSAYPVLLAIGSLCILTAITTVIVPRFEGMYLQLGVGVPRQTVVVARTLSVVPWACLAVFLLVAATCGLVYWRREKLSPFTLSLLRRIPGYSLLRLWKTQQFCFVVGLLTVSGVPLANGLERIRASGGPSWMKRCVTEICERLFAGEDLPQAFSGEFDPMLHLQLQRAVLSGEVGDGFLKTEAYVRTELLRVVGSLLRWLEPILTLLTGTMVAVTMYSLYGPMYSLMSTLSTSSH